MLQIFGKQVSKEAKATNAIDRARRLFCCPAPKIIPTTTTTTIKDEAADDDNQDDDSVGASQVMDIDGQPEEQDASMELDTMVSDISEPEPDGNKDSDNDYNNNHYHNNNNNNNNIDIIE